MADAIKMVRREAREAAEKIAREVATQIAGKEIKNIKNNHKLHIKTVKEEIASQDKKRDSLLQESLLTFKKEQAAIVEKFDKIISKLKTQHMLTELFVKREVAI